MVTRPPTTSTRVRTRPDAAVGAVLREARVRRGLTLDTAAEALRIPRQQLVSLEEGDLTVFAAEVYARGAFTRYAEYLGVRADGTQRAFLRTLSGARQYVPLRVHTPRSWLARVLTPRWILALALLTIALVVGSYILWQVQSFLRLPALTLTEPASSVVPGSTVTVRGSTEPGVQLQVNGTAVLTDAAGGFAVPLVLHPGINVLRVEATNAAGRVRALEQHLLMPRTL